MLFRRNSENLERLLAQRFVDGWKKRNESEILNALAEDCIIIESHGPTYRGKETVRKWINDWYGKGNTVEKWDITSFHVCNDLMVFEWSFAYKNEKIEEAFEGVSLAKIKNNKISFLREYRTTRSPFLWQPS